VETNRRDFLAAMSAVPLVRRLTPKRAERNPVRIIQEFLDGRGYALNLASFDRAAAMLDAEVAIDLLKDMQASELLTRYGVFSPAEIKQMEAVEWW
jgi:hypothetical protein